MALLRWLRRCRWLPTPQKARHSAWLPLLAWMGLIFFLSAQSDLPTPARGWLGRLLSSTAHAFVFGVLAILWLRVLDRLPIHKGALLPALGGRGRWTWFVAWVLTMLYALSDEFHQTFVPGRVADLWDLVCDGLGAALALTLLWLWRRRRGPRP